MLTIFLFSDVTSWIMINWLEYLKRNSIFEIEKYNDRLYLLFYSDRHRYFEFWEMTACREKCHSINSTNHLLQFCEFKWWDNHDIVVLLNFDIYYSLIIVTGLPHHVLPSATHVVSRPIRSVWLCISYSYSSYLFFVVSFILFFFSAKKKKQCPLFTIITMRLRTWYFVIMRTIFE